MLRLIDCIEASPLELFSGCDITDGKNYAYWHGEGTMLLQAHVDVIHPAKNIKVTNNIISGDGLGADDRAGVFACLYLRNKFPNVPVLFTNFEESGGKGMEAFVTYHIDLVGNVNMAIAIDRKGAGHYVTYNDLPKKCRRYVQSFGWHEETGSFSDIEIFTDKFEIPSINVSCGYYNQHTKSELLVIDELYLTISRLERMIKNPIAKLHRVKKKVYKSWWGSKEDSYGYADNVRYVVCPYCRSFHIQEYTNMYYCNDCGEAWESNYDAQFYSNDRLAI